ncbi:MAG: hypothetical protein ACRBN8_22385 [Nannocystales bacterium]
MSSAGKLTLHRVPRPILVAMLVAILVFLAHLFGLGEQVAGEDLATAVNRGLDGIVVLATFFGWSGLKLAVADPAKSVVD